MKKTAFIFTALMLSACLYFGSNSNPAIASHVDGILTDTTKKAKKTEVKQEAVPAKKVVDSTKSTTK